MTATIAIARQTSSSLLGLRRLIGFGLLELGPALIYLASAARVLDSELPERITSLTMLYLPVVVPVVAVVLAANALGGERRDETLSFLVLRPLPRSAISGAKIAGAAAAAVVLNAIGGLALGLVHVMIGGSSSFLLPLLVGGAVASLAYTAVFVPFGFLTERAVIVGLIFVFVFENGVISALSGLAVLSPWRMGFSAFVGLLPESVASLHNVDEIVQAALGSVAPGAGGSIVKAVVLTALAVGATAWLLRSRDLT